MGTSEMLDQHARLARHALGMVGAPDPDSVMQLARGMTSTAWHAKSDDGGWVARVPLPDSGRRLTYRVEAYIGAALAAAGHPAVAWRTVEVDGVPVSVGPYRSGVPVDPTHPWTERFAAATAATLVSLHGLECSGWGPLRDTDERLVGTSQDETTAVVGRWCHAPIWPFDGSDLHTHPLTRAVPELVGAVGELSGAIVAAAHGRHGLVHSDLHPHHLLVGADGGLAGVLDFGDAFIGSRAWDFALLIHYYGPTTGSEVARHYGADERLLADAHELAVAVAVYKIAKAGGRHADIERLRRRLRERSSSSTTHD